MTVGRPKKQIDYEVVEKLSNIQCTQQEIADYLNISVRTLQRDKEFCRIYNKGMQNGKMSIRRWQYASAKKGNVRMLIWLGKQYLGQKEVVEQKSDDEIVQKINDLNKTIIENVAPTRSIEDFEDE